MIIAFTIFTGITVYLVYYNWYLINNNNDDDDNHNKNKNLMNVIIKKMNTTKEINIKNQKFDAKLLKIDKKSNKDINIFDTGYVTKEKIGNGMHFNSVNLLYLGIAHVNGYIEEKDSNKYLVFDSTDKNKEFLEKYSDVFNGIKDKIENIDDNDSDYEKEYMKIKFNSDDDLTLNKLLKFHLMTITIRHVFEEDGKLYPQVFLDDAWYEL